MGLTTFQDASDTLDGQIDHQSFPSSGKLGANAALQCVLHLHIIMEVNWHRDLLHDLESLGQGLVVSAHDDRGVHVSLNERSG